MDGIIRTERRRERGGKAPGGVAAVPTPVIAEANTPRQEWSTGALAIVSAIVTSLLRRD